MSTEELRYKRYDWLDMRQHDDFDVMQDEEGKEYVHIDLDKDDPSTDEKVYLPEELQTSNIEKVESESKLVKF